MSHKLRTPEQVCIAYAEAVAEVRRLTSKIGICECIRSVRWNAEVEEYWRDREDSVSLPAAPYGEAPTTCLHDYFHAPVGPEGDIHPNTARELMANLCSPCSEAYEYIQTRKKARQAAGAAKRAVEAVGKRLKAVQS